VGRNTGNKKEVKIMKNQALQYLEKVAEEIAAEHRSGVCNHYGACEYVGPFVKYMQKNPDDAHDFELWAREVGDHEKLYGAIFDGGARIDEAPEHHVSDVARFHEICRAHGIEV
jgi:hypothetical protein